MADDLMMMLRGLQASARRAPRLYRDLGHPTLTPDACASWPIENDSMSMVRQARGATNQQRVTAEITPAFPRQFDAGIIVLKSLLSGVSVI
ncbi:hypothetical protein ACVIHI_003467 [Bradyrhizobium sp. USDA 4524]|uniref:hypothetical protein n=1 Tax=unclassified Bradyrhizobium TaxID=2631580 RepID=UPI00209F2E7A|nr:MULTISPECIES: hypothetical protein [unclassified Bradyrhizobium]MCP1843615.1 hypothetical protein [Bradyrhizobium sp. USDA 4538]MCP1904181.1 hypothetical protein [Bradyrhizobium sp. USDA 4537]MCP1990163.1 hypothetical protein [Bradyrhizobium sp. USDA 4539]